MPATKLKNKAVRLVPRSEGEDVAAASYPASQNGAAASSGLPPSSATEGGMTAGSSDRGLVATGVPPGYAFVPPFCQMGVLPLDSAAMQFQQQAFQQTGGFSPTTAAAAGYLQQQNFCLLRQDSQGPPGCFLPTPQFEQDLEQNFQRVPLMQQELDWHRQKLMSLEEELGSAKERLSQTEEAAAHFQEELERQRAEAQSYEATVRALRNGDGLEVFRQMSLDSLAKLSRQLSTQIGEKLCEQKQCEICYENNKDMFLNCGHMMCRRCVNQLSDNTCPFCKTVITRTTQAQGVFMD